MQGNGKAGRDQRDRERRAEVERMSAGLHWAQRLRRHKSERWNEALADGDAKTEHDERRDSADEPRAAGGEVPRRKLAHGGCQREAR
jgi:hypothetical protein